MEAGGNLNENAYAPVLNGHDFLKKKPDVCINVIVFTVCLSKDWLLMLGASKFDGENRLVLYHYVIFH